MNRSFLCTQMGSNWSTERKVKYTAVVIHTASAAGVTVLAEKLLQGAELVSGRTIMFLHTILTYTLLSHGDQIVSLFDDYDKRPFVASVASAVRFLVMVYGPMRGSPLHLFAAGIPLIVRWMGDCGVKFGGIYHPIILAASDAMSTAAGLHHIRKRILAGV